jgi:hypothetical protein
VKQRVELFKHRSLGRPRFLLVTAHIKMLNEVLHSRCAWGRWRKAQFSSRALENGSRSASKPTLFDAWLQVSVHPQDVL